MPKNVPAAAMDRCYTNSASVNEMNEAAKSIGETERFVTYCVSHLINNAGEKAAFVTVDLFWALCQKVFALSTQAQNLFREVGKGLGPLTRRLAGSLSMTPLRLFPSASNSC